MGLSAPSYFMPRQSFFDMPLSKCHISKRTLWYEILVIRGCVLWLANADMNTLCISCSFPDQNKETKKRFQSHFVNLDSVQFMMNQAFMTSYYDIISSAQSQKDKKTYHLTQRKCPSGYHRIYLDLTLNLFETLSCAKLKDYYFYRSMHIVWNIISWI